MHRWQEAVVAADLALQIDNNYQGAKNAKVEVLDFLGNIEYRSKNYGAALEKYEQAIQLDPMCEDFYSNKALVLNYLGRFREAVVVADLALQMNTNYQPAKNVKAEALSALGNIDYQSTNYSAALAKFEESIQLNPMCGEFYSNKAATLLRLGRNQEALKEADLALQINTNYQPAKNLKARALSALGNIDYQSTNYSAALEKYEQATQLNSENKVFHLSKDWALFKLQRYQETADAAGKALQIDINYQAAKNAKASALYNLGNIEHNNKNYQVALQKYEQAIQLNPMRENFYSNKVKPRL